MKKLTAILLAGVASTGIAHAQLTPMELSNILRPGMTPDQVRDIGGSPAHTQVGACGAAYGEKWSCMIWTYEKRPDFTKPYYVYDPAGFQNLWVYFSQSNGQWVVNSWL